MHNLWCETLRQTILFPQPNSVLCTPTAREYEKYGQGKPLPAPKVPVRHVHNQVVYDDLSEAGDAPAITSIGVDHTDVPYDDPVLSRVRLKSYAAAGSATQTTTDKVVIRVIEHGPTLPTALLDDDSALNKSTQTDRSYGFSDVVLNRIEHYVRHQSLPWQVRTLLPGIFNLLPSHDPAMLAIATTSVI